MEGCEIYKEERDVLGEMRNVDECDMDTFSTLDNREKTIATLGDIDGGHQRRNRKGTR